MDYLASQEAFAAADASGQFKEWTSAQMEAFLIWEKQLNDRLLLYYPTGKGKTKVSLAMLRAHGYDEVIIIAPPKVQGQWQIDAETLGFKRIVIVSVEKFRMKDTKLPRIPLIVDEMHKLGKHNGAGFKKLDRMATGFPAIILCSATPNWNDADRCYNVCHVLDTINNMGGFPKWVDTHCTTVINYYSKGNDVTGFKDFDNAAEFLAALPYTAYLPDEAAWVPHVLSIDTGVNLYSIDELGYSGRKHRIMASQMEERWHRRRLILLQPEERELREEVIDALHAYIAPLARKFLLYSKDKIVAKAAVNSMERNTPYAVFVITGDTPTKQVPEIRDAFIHWDGPAVLVGTDAIAEGVDKLERVCDHLVILLDTDDDAKRRQFIGRVLPRGGVERPTYVTTVVTSQ